MKRYKNWIYLLAALVLAACSDDSEQTVTPVDPVGPVEPVILESPLKPTAITRTLSADDVTADATGEFAPIQIFLMSGESDDAITHKTEGLFIFDTSTGWTSTIGLKDTYNCVYGFSPSTSASGSISLPDGKTSFKDGAVLTLEDLSPVTGDDVCIIVGLRPGETKEAVSTIPDRGVFYIEKKTNNYVSLLLDHLFARIDFKVKIGPEYSTIRSIKIKKIELLTSVLLTGATVTLTPNASNTDPVSAIFTTTAIAEGADKTSGILYDYTTDTDASHSEGWELTTSGITIPGFFAPSGSTPKVGDNLFIRWTYDIYNIKGTRVRVREDCVAENRLPAFTIARGEKTTVNLTVEPTYLYVLSDDDLDNPTVKIDN